MNSSHFQSYWRETDELSIEQHPHILLEKKLYSLKNHVKMFTEEKHFVQITVFENDSKNYRFNSHTKKDNAVSTLIFCIKLGLERVELYRASGRVGFHPKLVFLTRVGFSGTRSSPT